MLALAVVAVLAWQAREVPDRADPSPILDDDRPVMVALGDSFMSGEGAPRYLEGTNEPSNLCHRARTAYPYLVARELRYRLVFAACSGATTDDILGPLGQYPQSSEGSLGGAPQIDALASSQFHSDPGQVDLVLVSIGGNDAGFGDVVRTCITSRCTPRGDQWLALVDRVRPRLDIVFAEIKDLAPAARVVVMTYPEPFVVSECLAGNLQIESDEIAYVLDEYLYQLNNQIELAALGAGVESVDTRRSFRGARLCESREAADGPNADDQPLIRGEAMNLITLSSGGSKLSDLVKGSFHPTVLGHEMLTDTVLQHLEGGAIRGPIGLPPSDGAANSQPPGGPPDVPPLGFPDDTPPGEVPPGPPPIVEYPPLGPYPFPTGTPCSGEELASSSVRTLTAGERSIAITDAAPNSQYCYLTAPAVWDSAMADPSGELVVDVARVERAVQRKLEVVYESVGGSWKSALFYPPAEAGRQPLERPLEDNLRLLVTLAVIGVAWVIGAWGMCIRCLLRQLRELKPQLAEAH